MDKAWGGTVFVALAAVLGCNDIPIDPVGRSGKSSKQVLGLIEGSVVYEGPQVDCDFQDDVAVRIRGRVILTLFDFNNPPPPAGKATSAISVLSINGDRLFSLADCKPPGVTRGPPVTRSVSFTWPELPMARSFQIRGFYDNDGDFIPFFTATRSATADDVVGAAGDAIDFGTLAQFPQGQAVRGVVVSLRAPVLTEVPLFEVALSPVQLRSDATFTEAVPQGNPTDKNAAVNSLWNLARLTLTYPGSEKSEYASALAAAGLRLKSTASPTWHIRSIDLTRIDPVTGRLEQGPDNTPDPHPVLKNGLFAEVWRSPFVYAIRARTAAEIQARIPNVTLIGSPRFDQDPEGTDRQSSSINITLPPVAIVDLNPTRPECSIPYIPSGNPVETYVSDESLPEPAKECQELPTGEYSLTIFHGLAGQSPENARLSGQSWTVPNELGPPDTRYDPSAFPQLDPSVLVGSQGPSQRPIVYDPTTADGVRPPCGLPAGTLKQVPEVCCAAVANLCGLPLCETEVVGTGVVSIRRLNRLQNDGTPSCVPFLPPASCCPS